MRSDIDKRSETQREIDDFLSKFEDPADELSADYSSYLNEKNTTKMTAAQTFHWKNVELPDFKKETAVKDVDVPDVSADAEAETKADKAPELL